MHGPSRTDSVNVGIRNMPTGLITVCPATVIEPADRSDQSEHHLLRSGSRGIRSRHDRKTGEIVYIQPQARASGDPAGAVELGLADPDQPARSEARIYVGTVSASGGATTTCDDSWTRDQSGDLTRNEDRLHPASP